MSEAAPERDDTPLEQPGISPPRPRRGFRVLGVVFISAALLLSMYLVVAFLGWQSGQALLTRKQQEQLAAQIARQLELAQEDMATGSPGLAARRLEWILTQAPAQPEALALQQQVAAMLTVTATPRAMVVTAPTPTPEPTPTPGVISNPTSELQRIRRLIDRERWDEAIPALIVFQRQFPDERRRETDSMLYEAYIGQGLLLIEGEQAELGLFYLEQAEKLGDLPQEVQDYRLWAEWYLQGIAFYGANWDIAVGYFRDLCLVAPFYQSSCQVLATALEAYGDQYAFVQEWCPAQALYEEAQAHENRAALGQKAQAARQACLQATPTPGVISGTLPLTGTFPFGGVPPAPPEETGSIQR